MPYRGVLLDFYGTVVAEDGPLIRNIVRRIAGGYSDYSGSALAPAWGRNLPLWLAALRGATLRAQRDLEIESLSSVLDTVGSPLDATELSRDQFNY